MDDEDDELRRRGPNEVISIPGEAASMWSETSDILSNSMQYDPNVGDLYSTIAETYAVSFICY